MFFTERLGIHARLPGLLLGGVLLFGLVPQYVGSRPFNAGGKTQESLAVSLSARAGGKLEDRPPPPPPPLPEGKNKPSMKSLLKRGAKTIINGIRDKHTLAVLANTESKLTHCSDDVKDKCAVGVGVKVKRFLGFDTRAGTWTAQLIFTLRWDDRRTIKLIPCVKQAKSLGPEMGCGVMEARAPHITFGKDQAKRKMWYPQMSLVNRQLKASDSAFWEVEVYKNGTCILIQELLVTVKQGFDYTAYPFDVLNFQAAFGMENALASEEHLSIASYMDKDDMEVISRQELSRAGFTLVEWNMNVTEDLENGLTDSSDGWTRAVLTMKVKRHYWKILEVNVAPEMIVVAIVWLVFFFPRPQGYIMARVSSLMIAMLIFLQDRAAINKSLPPSRQCTCWLEGFQDSCLELTVLAMFINVFAEIMQHSWGHPDLAARMLRVTKYSFPGLFFIICFVCGHYIGRIEPNAIHRMTMWILIFTTAYGFAFFFHYRKECMRVESDPDYVPGQHSVQVIKKGKDGVKKFGHMLSEKVLGKQTPAQPTGPEGSSAGADNLSPRSKLEPAS